MIHVNLLEFAFNINKTNLGRISTRVGPALSIFLRGASQHTQGTPGFLPCFPICVKYGVHSEDDSVYAKHPQRSNVHKSTDVARTFSLNINGTEVPPFLTNTCSSTNFYMLYKVSYGMADRH